MRNSVASMTNIFERALFAPSLAAIDAKLEDGSRCTAQRILVAATLARSLRRQLSVQS
jgi:hypothetical protein